MSATADEVSALEAAEVEAFADFYRAATPEIVEQAGIAVRELEEGVVLGANRLDVLALNRAVGVGLAKRPSDDALTEMIGAFEAIGSPRFFVQVAPTETTADLGPRLEALGLRHYNNWIRLRRELKDLPEARPSSVSVTQIGPELAETFSTIVADAFHYPPAVTPLTGCAIGRPGWNHYLAMEEGEPIGAAAMYVAGRAAWFGFAATVEARRGRGAQTALVTRRMADAAREGCTWVSVETAEQTPDREAPSFRNLTRLGFEVTYVRPNYLWVREEITRPSA